MTALVTQRFHRLADSLAELKFKVRAALASELAGAVGTAVRDVLIVALLDRLITPTAPDASGWREEEYERDRWRESRDPWGDPDDDEPRSCRPTSYEPTNRADSAPAPAVPVAAALAVGVNVGRWWLARQGTVASAVGFGVLATALGLAGGPVARAALAVLTVATDLLTAEATLARLTPS